MYACLYRPPDHHDDQRSAPEARRELVAIAQEFSPRYESYESCADAVSAVGAVMAVMIDVRGLERLLGHARTIGEELRREAAQRGVRAHIAVAGTCTAALVLALARPGLTVIDPGAPAAGALAPLPIGILEKIDHDDQPRARGAGSATSAFYRWGVKTLGEIAALPSADLSARLGRQGLVWQAIARGEDLRPLVPDVAEERFESSMALEWPIEGLEPLSFVLTRLLEPLSVRLERRDRGVAVLHVQLGLVTKETHARSLQLPSPLRDVRTLRTLALLDLASHPPPAAIDRVAIVIDPTPGRVAQHTLFARPHLTPEQMSTLLARLAAVMGQDRIGAPATVDSYRPGAFAMKPFATDHDDQRRGRRARRVTALCRCRQPVPARVAADVAGRPVRVTTDRRGFAGGSVVHASGPWSTSGEWWAGDPGDPGDNIAWDRHEWDVTLNDGGAYRIFLDRVTGGWFIDAIVD